MSLELISLALVNKLLDGEPTPTASENLDEDEDKERVRIAKLVEKLRLHTIFLCMSLIHKIIIVSLVCRRAVDLSLFLTQ
jgi:hypothetical protein